MKKIILIVGGIIVVAILGRLGWAYYEVQNNTSAPITMTAEPVVPVVSTQLPASTDVVATTINTCSLSKQANEILVSGRVVFPKGISLGDEYTIVGNKSYSINKDGTFCIVGAKGGPALMMALGPNENSFELATVINSAINLSGVRVDAKSTAVALVFMSPLIGPGNPNPKILDVIAASAEVIKFATDINALSNLTSNDLDKGGRLFNDYTNAVTSVLKSLAPATVAPSTIEFTAVFSPGLYTTGVVQGVMASVTPTFVGGIDVKKILQRGFNVTDTTKFLNTAKPIGTQIIEFKSATITGYYDVRKQTVFVESISNVQL